MTKRRTVAATALAVLGLAGLGLVLRSARAPEDTSKFEAADHQQLIGADRQQVLQALELPADLEWTSLDSFYHGTIHQLDLPGMSVVCYEDWVVAVEPNAR